MLRREAKIRRGFWASLALAAVAAVAWGCGANASSDSGVTSSAELASATDGGDPYAALDGLADGELVAGLYDLVKNHHALGYNGARAVLLHAPTLHPGQPLECVYTGRTVDPDGTNTPG